MAISFSSGCVPFNGSSPTDNPSLSELLPKTARPLAMMLSVEEREVLTYLILFGLHIQLLKGALPPASRTLWKPWKSSTASTYSAFPNPKLHNSQQVSSFSDNRNKGPICDCFDCYSSYWTSWNSSPNRDLISDILEMVELQDKALIKANKSNSKKKKNTQQCQEKNTVIPAKAPKVKPKKNIGSSTQVNTEMFTLKNENGKNQSEAANTSEMALKNCESTTPLRLSRRARKAMQSKKEAAKLIEVKNEAMAVVKTETLDRVSEIGDKADANEKAEAPSLHLTLTHNRSQQHRAPKRKCNQVMPMPLDCDEFQGVAEVELDKEMLSRSSSSPRVADTNLSGRGFLARVFPDALGGVASRLWDLVSLRLRSRTMDYY